MATQISNDPEANQITNTTGSGTYQVPKRYFALYTLDPLRNRSPVTSTSTEPEDAETDLENNRSLSVIATNLIAAAETDLRKSLLNLLSKDSIVPGKGRFSSLGLNLESEQSVSSICYNCVIKLPTTDALGFDHVSPDDTMKDAEAQQLFIVSFVSFEDSSLDLFRNEFDKYVDGLNPLLDKELYVSCPESACESANNSATSGNAVICSDLSQLGTGIQSYLEKWPSTVLGYLTRTIDYMGPNIEHLIYAALQNASLQISGASSEKEEDIKKFYQCCSLSTLLERLQPDPSLPNISLTTSSESADIWQLQAPIFSVTFTPAEVPGSPDQVQVIPASSCSFCKNSADKFVTMDTTNVTKVRDFLESIKLAFIHNLNKLKRYLKMAEVDYYALYRSLSYLRKCGCGELLLQYVKIEGGPETLSVLTVLETFIKDMRQNLT